MVRDRRMDGRAARSISTQREFFRRRGSLSSTRMTTGLDCIDLLDALHPQTILAYG